jgi:hypothetical protein
MLIRRTLTAALAAAALVAPAAQAQGADHVVARADAHQSAKQDMRSPDARDAAEQRYGRVAVPAYATVADPPSRLPAGQPTWPVNPTPISAARADEPSNGGDAWPVPVLPIAGFALAVIIAVAGARYGVRRSHRRARIAA